MNENSPTAICAATTIHVHNGFADQALLARLEKFLLRNDEPICLSKHPACLDAVAGGLKHKSIYLEALAGDQTCGYLALAFVRSAIFGRFLVSLPFLNYGGIQADDETIERLLIDKAVELANQHDVRHLELRHEQPIPNSSMTHSRSDKIHMHLELPASGEELWQQVSGKVRNQIRKAQKQRFTVAWGRETLLSEFYAVFSRNMRDLGTPVFGKRLFQRFLDHFPERAEFCVLRDGAKPIASAFILHGWGVTEVPSASSLRAYNSTCANMLLYWHLLERTIERGNQVFDFGRSSKESPTFRFKKQWGAQPSEASWQYYVRTGSVDDTRRDNPRYERFIRLWQRLPVSLTRLIGPIIVRGIP